MLASCPIRNFDHPNVSRFVGNPVVGRNTNTGAVGTRSVAAPSCNGRRACGYIELRTSQTIDFATDNLILKVEKNISPLLVPRRFAPEPTGVFLRAA